MSRWKARKWARSYGPGRRRRSRSTIRDADSAASAWASSPAVAGQDPLAQLVRGQLPCRHLDEKGQVIGTWLQALGPHRRQRCRYRMLPFRGLLQGLVLLCRHKYRLRLTVGADEDRRVR